MKYIVILLEVKAQPILCDSVGAVYDILKEASTRANVSWSVWEVVNGKAEFRVVDNALDMQLISIY